MPTDPRIEEHPLPFFLPANARLLMLGTFPPKRERWSMEFFYPNFQNDMWRIFGVVFFGNKDYFMAETPKRFDQPRIEAFLREKGIAIGDTAREVIRLKDNASDQFLEIVTPLDLAQTLSLLPQCRAIVTTGGKSTETLLSLLPAPMPPVGGCSTAIYRGKPLTLYRMPSSSRAYPKPLPEKAAIYRTMFDELGLL